MVVIVPHTLAQPVFERWLAQQAGRLFLWLPVCLGAGMALYYALPFEPSRVLYLAPLFLPLLSFPRTRESRGIRLFCLALVLVLMGGAYAQFRAQQMEGRMLSAPLGIRPVTGVIDSIEPVPNGVRLTLSQVAIDRLPPEETPSRVRVSLRAKTLPLLSVGEKISVRAGLLPPSGPVMPGSFNFARYFFFRKIGAVGYAVMPVASLTPPQGHGFTHFWQNVRADLTRQIQIVLPGIEGAVATGLITGEDSAIPRMVHEQLRIANLLHVIAISGAHMVVIAGIVFVGLRAILVLIPHYGERPEIKPIVAALTLIAISLYLCVTGFELSAVRSYIMLAILLIAILVGREPQPMRSIALAALCMLAYDPSDVIEPGFQLSFAATAALIAAFECLFQSENAEDVPWRRALRVVAFMCLTSLIAEAATAPLVLFHFNTISLYGIFANLVLTPVITLVLMPMVALYFILLPLGMEAYALQGMAYGIQAMLWVAKTVSTWPHALTYAKAPTEWGVVLITLGLAWLCIWQGRIRACGVAAMVAGVLSLLTVRSPVLFLSPDLRQIALQTEKGYVLLRGRSFGLFSELWANGVGQQSFPTYAQAKPLQEAECDRERCRIFLPQDERPLAIHLSFTVSDIKQGCPSADYWISGYFLYPNERRGCREGTGFWDRADFYAEGPAWGWVTPKGLHIESSRSYQGKRPWS